MLPSGVPNARYCSVTFAAVEPTFARKKSVVYMAGAATVPPAARATEGTMKLAAPLPPKPVEAKSVAGSFVPRLSRREAKAVKAPPEVVVESVIVAFDVLRVPVIVWMTRGSWVISSGSSVGGVSVPRFAPLSSRRLIRTSSGWSVALTRTRFVRAVASSRTPAIAPGEPGEMSWDAITAGTLWPKAPVPSGVGVVVTLEIFSDAEFALTRIAP